MLVYSLIFRPSLFTIHYFFGSLFTFHYKKGHYSLIIIPHPDPLIVKECAQPQPGNRTCKTADIRLDTLQTAITGMANIN